MLTLLTQVLHDATAGDGHAVCTVAIAVFSLGFLLWQLTMGKWEPVLGFVVFAAIMVGHRGGLSAPSNLASHMPYILLVSVVAAAVVAAPLKAPSATGNEGFAVGIEGFAEHDNNDDDARANSTEEKQKKKKKKKKKAKNNENMKGEDEEPDNNEEDEDSEGESESEHDGAKHDSDHTDTDEHGAKDHDAHEHSDMDHGDNDHGDKDHDNKDHDDNDTGNTEPFTDSADDDTEPFKVDEFKSFLDTYKNVTPSQLKHMTDDTKNLLETQKTLIDTIKTMSPVLKEGKQVLDTFKDYFSLDDKKAMEQMFKSYKDK